MWRKSVAQETKYWLFRVSPQTNAPKFTFSTVTTSLWQELSRDSKGSRIRDKWRVLTEAVLIVSWETGRGRGGLQLLAEYVPEGVFLQASTSGFEFQLTIQTQFSVQPTVIVPLKKTRFYLSESKFHQYKPASSNILTQLLTVGHSIFPNETYVVMLHAHAYLDRPSAPCIQIFRPKFCTHFFHLHLRFASQPPQFP